MGTGIAAGGFLLLVTDIIIIFIDAKFDITANMSYDAEQIAYAVMTGCTVLGIILIIIGLAMHGIANIEANAIKNMEMCRALFPDKPKEWCTAFLEVTQR